MRVHAVGDDAGAGGQALTMGVQLSPRSVVNWGYAHLTASDQTHRRPTQHVAVVVFTGPEHGGARARWCRRRTDVTDLLPPSRAWPMRRTIVRRGSAPVTSCVLPKRRLGVAGGGLVGPVRTEARVVANGGHQWHAGWGCRAPAPRSPRCPRSSHASAWACRHRPGSRLHGSQPP